MVHVPADVGETGPGGRTVSIRLWVLRANQPLVARFPGAFYRFAWLAGWLSFHLQPRARRNVIRNMLAFTGGDRLAARRAALGVFRNIAQYYVDLCTLPSRDMQGIEAGHLELVRGDRLAELDHPGPIVIVSAHTGNAEMAIQALTYRGRPFVALVEAQQPPAWSRYLRRLRSSAGGEFHETTFAGIRACIETLHEGGLAGFMGDRDIQGNGLCTALAGRSVRLPTGPWEIARKTDARVFPIFSTRIKHDRFRVFVEQPFKVASTEDEDADIAAAVRRFAALLEEHLTREPSQWAFTEDFWKVHACG